MGVCPYARALAAEAIDDSSLAAVILTTRCDQMRRAVDLIRQAISLPVFLLNLPKTWHTQQARDLYRQELDRMLRFLVDVGGHMPSDQEIADATRRYAAQRQRDCFTDTVEVGANPARVLHAGCSESVPLALVGGPLLDEHSGILDTIAGAGGRIALDATEAGERVRPGCIDEAQLAAAPVDELARIYFAEIPDVFQRPHSRLHDWLAGRLSQRGIRGLIVHRYVWCDLWHAEVQRLRDCFDMPVLDLEQGDDNGATESRLATRIQAFMESIR